MGKSYGLALGIICYYMANFIYAPVLPDVATYFDASSDIVKATMTYFQVGAVISCILAVFFGDYIGKKNFINAGLLLAVSGSVICMMSSTVNLLMVGRFLQGIGAATGMMMAITLMMDLFEPMIAVKIIAITGAINTTAAIFVPYIGGLFSGLFNWRSTFVFISILYMITLIFNLKNLQSKSNVRKPDLALAQSVHELIKIAKNMRYLSYASLSSFLNAGLVASLTFLPFYCKAHLKLDEGNIGIIIGIAIFLPFACGSFLSIKLYDRIGIDRTIKLSLLACAVGASTMILTGFVAPYSLPLIVIANVLYFGGFGTLFAGTAGESMKIFKELTTKASSLRIIMITICSAFGALIAQNIGDEQLIAFGTLLIMTVIACAIMFMMRGEVSES